MKVKGMIESDVDTFKVGDVIEVKLADGVKVQAMAVQQEEDGIMARFFVYSTKEAAAALKEAHIPYRVHGEYCISVNNDDYSTAVEAFFRNDVSFQPE